MEFVEIIKCIFEDKARYSTISDKDKIASFYMINKKFSMKYPKRAAFFNDKSVDRASALDLWFKLFSDIHSIPYWVWAKSSNKKEKVKKLSAPDKKMIIEEFELTEKEYDFIYTNYPDEIDYELKMLKRWKK